jgi:hypothetical protein
MFDLHKVEFLPFKAAKPVNALEKWALGMIASGVSIATFDTLFDMARVFRREFESKRVAALSETLDAISEALEAIAQESYDDDIEAFDGDLALQEMLAEQTNIAQENVREQFSQLGIINSQGVQLPPWAFYQSAIANAVALETEPEGTPLYFAIRNTVKEMVKSGIRDIRYPKHTDRIEVAVRRSILEGIKATARHVEQQRAERLGLTTFEVTYHEGHRESHGWGGRRFSTVRTNEIDTQTGHPFMTEEEMYENYGGGTLADWNCYHNVFAVRPSDRAQYKENELIRLEERENQTKTYNGKEYTLRQTTEHQRDMERRMRRLRMKAHILNEGGDKEGYLASRARYYALRHEYIKFSRAIGVPVEFERVYYDMLGRI